jgi:hypothetical protein
MFGLSSGFDVVIGNPPYGASLGASDKNYFLKNYESAQTIKGKQKGSLDTFSLFIEQGHRLLKNNGSLYFIVPLTITSGDSMTALHNILFATCNDIKVSSYCDRPLQIFKNAHKKISIISFTKTGTPCKSIQTTKMNRWHKGIPLQQLIENLQFTESINYCLFGRLSKIGLKAEAGILDKIFSSQNKPIGDIRGEKGGSIYYRLAGGMYFNIITNYLTGSTQEKALYFDKKMANSIGAILSSNLFFWFQQVYSDNLHLKSYEIDSFTIPAKELTPKRIEKIETIYAEYLKDIEANAVSHTTDSYVNVDSFKEYKIRKSKHLIDKIDDIICPLYGLTQEETDFIKNYEIEFRLDE